MIISRKIISQWIDISKIKDDEITKALNNLGFEVEKVINLAKQNSKLVVGQITSIQTLPLSDKLKTCIVDIGTTSLTIVCGASNVYLNDKVIVAQVGSHLASNLKIGVRKIQGVTSHGMLCSLPELGLKQSVLSQSELDGIVILPATAKIGDSNPLALIGLDETIFELQLTLNRSDCLAMYSLAKELQQHFNLIWKPMAIADLPTTPSTQKIEVISAKINALASLQIVLTGKEQFATSLQLRRILQLANIKPENGWTDLVNLVMLEVGQPLLAFNGQNLHQLAFHLAVKDYPGQEFNIYSEDIVLHEKILAFHNLGIGTDKPFQVNQATKNCLLLSINPDLTIMQAQVKRHEIENNLLLSRLNKPVVPDYYLIALQRFLYLLKQVTTYEILKFSDDVPYQITAENRKINWKQINEILGVNYSSEVITNSLKQIGCQILNVDKDIIELQLPSHRNDLNLINDFAEEVMRVNGYDKLKSLKPTLSFNHKQTQPQLPDLLNKLRQFLLNLGFNRVKTYSLTSKVSLNYFNYFDYQMPITLLAPSSHERCVMRFSLVEALFNICQSNLAHKQTEQLKFFTDDVVYSNDETSDDHLLAFLVYQSFFDEQITVNNFNQNQFFVMKGVFESLLTKVLKLPITKDLTFQPVGLRYLNPYASFKIIYQQQQIAVIASTHPNLTREYGFTQPAYFVEVNCSRLQAILEQKPKSVQFQKWSKFNSLSRDLSLILSETIKYSTIETAILKTEITDLVAIKLIDCYRDQQLITQKLYSITINLQFNSEFVQLDEEKINPAFAEIKELLINQFSAQIR